MTDVYPPLPQPAPEPLPAPPVKKSGNPLGLVALIVGIVAFITAVIPASAFSTWFFAIVAIVFGIIALAKKRAPRWMGLVGIIVAAVAWLIAIIVVVVFLVSGAASSVSEGFQEGLASASAAAEDPSGSAEQSSAPDDTGEPEATETTEESAAPSAASEFTIGDTVANDDGVSFTVNSVKCGLKSAGESILAEDAKGQFCEAKITIENGGEESVSVLSSDVTGQIGSADYEADSTVSMFDDDYFTTDINPGLSADCELYFDIPKDSKLDTLTYNPTFTFFTGPVVIAVN